MISTTKKIAYGLVLLASSALFANEVLKATRSDPAPAPLERPAEGEVARGSVEAPATNGAPFVTPAADPEFDPEALFGADAGERPQRADLGVVLDSLESALARMDAGRRPEPGRKLDPLARARRLQGARSADAMGSQAATPETDLAARRDSAESRARLQQFLEQSPLTGVVRGERESAAMFGGRIVRVGDALLGDDGELLRIDEHGLVVSLSGRETRISVPPVQPRSAGVRRTELEPPAAAPQVAPVAGPDLSTPANPEPSGDSR